MLAALAALLLSITTYNVPLPLEVRPTRSASPVLLHASETTNDSQVYDSYVTDHPTDSTKRLHWISEMDSPVATGTQSIALYSFPKSDATSQTRIGQIFTPGSGDLSHVRLGTPFLESGTTWYLYYSRGQGDSIALAISTDGPDGPYDDRRGDVLTADGQGRDDGTHVSDPDVFKVGSTWYMHYSYRGTLTLPGVRYATSSDGITWTKGGSGDIISAQTGFFLEKHQCFLINGVYVMFYDSGNTSNPYREYVATSGSPSGPFTNINLSPFLTETLTATWDKWHVCCFGVWYEDTDSTWRAFYCGTDDDSSGSGQPYSNCTWDIGLLTWKSRAAGGGNGRSQGGRRNAFHVPGSLERSRDWVQTQFGRHLVWGIAP